MTFLIDIGRVLLDFDFTPMMSRLIPPGTADPEGRMERVFLRKDEFESGKIDAAAYIPWAIETLGTTASHQEFTEAWQQIFTPNEPMWECVRQLAADGHRLILFSNTNTIHWSGIVGTYDIFAHFPEAVLSFETGFIKPEHGIYQHAIRVHGLVPSETLYIDDLAPNIDAGREFGFRGWQYDLNDHDAFEKWLAAELARSPVQP